MFSFYSAEADSTVALQLDTTYVKAYHRRAQARVELKQYHEAKQDIEKLLELEPSNKEGRSMLLQVNQAISNQKVSCIFSPFRIHETHIFSVQIQLHEPTNNVSKFILF